jgi:hypothetical protein
VTGVQTCALPISREKLDPVLPGGPVREAEVKLEPQRSLATPGASPETPSGEDPRVGLLMDQVSQMARCMTDFTEVVKESASAKQGAITKIEKLKKLPKMEFVKFKGDPATYLTFIRGFESGFEYNELPEENKGQWLISLLEDKAMEAVKMIQEPRPSFEKVKGILELLYNKPKDRTTKLMELDNLKSSDYESVADFAHELMVKAAEAYPELTGKPLDRIVMAKLLRGLPKKTRERFDSSLYPSTTLLVQSIQQAEELAKIDAPPETVLTGRKVKLTKPAPEEAVVCAPVACAPVACSPAPDATIRALAALETKLQDSDRRQEDRGRQMTKDIDQLARDVSNRRPMSPYRPTSSLSDMSSVSRDTDRSASRSSGFGGYNRGRSPARETPSVYNRDHISLPETQARIEQARKMKAFQKANPSGGGQEKEKKFINSFPPPGYTGGYKGSAFNPKIWEADQRVKKEKEAESRPPIPPPDKPPEPPANQ